LKNISLNKIKREIKRTKINWKTSKLKRKFKKRNMLRKDKYFRSNKILLKSSTSGISLALTLGKMRRFFLKS